MIEELNKETLIRLYIKEKRPLLDIAEMFGRSYTFVRHRCKKYAIELRPKGGEFVELKKSVLRGLCVREGKSAREIAEMFSCSSDTVRNRCRQYGLKLRGYRRIKGLSKSLLQKLYVKEGKTIREVAKILCCSHETVRERCKQYGIKLRPRNYPHIVKHKRKSSKQHTGSKVNKRRGIW